MVLLKDLGMAETPHNSGNSFLEWFSGIQFFAVALLIPLWRGIDKYFEYKSKKDSEYIRQVVEESMAASMRELREDLKEIKQTMDQDRKDNSKEFKALTQEIYKHRSS